MKIITILLYLMLSMSPLLFAGNFSIFEIDNGNFPAMRAKIIAYDEDGRQIKNINSSNLILKENGIQRTVTRVTCPDVKPPKSISSVLTIDVSGSMSWDDIPNIELSKEAARVWIEEIPLETSECAITAFNMSSHLIQDFTNDIFLLNKGINSLFAFGGTNYDAALLDSNKGALEVSKNAVNKPIIVFLTDGLSEIEPRTELIIATAKTLNVSIYAVSLKMSCPESLKEISTQTGGLWYENIIDVQELRSTFRKILLISQEQIIPCEIEWQSDYSCYDKMTDIQLSLPDYGLMANAAYNQPWSSIINLELDPESIRFMHPVPGVLVEKTMFVKADKSGFNVTDITSSNPAYTVSPKSFSLSSGETIQLTVSYLPADSGYTYCRFEIINDKCPTDFYASGGWPGRKPKIQTLKLIEPDGGEELVVGMDSLITWEGILPEEPVIIEYSTNRGLSWIMIDENATGLSYNWKVPKTPSNNCLARVTAKSDYLGCDNPDVVICGKTWMGCNLDVDTYRNGDPIPEVTDPVQWANMKTGAWCYYDNDPDNGIIYGKLYNWYAINDPRGLAPAGWRIPTDAELTALANCLGGENVAGGKLKSTGSREDRDGLWRRPNVGATNQTGFLAQPGGYRGYDSEFGRIGYGGYFWTSTETSLPFAIYRYLLNDSAELIKLTNVKSNGYSIRCIRD